MLAHVGLFHMHVPHREVSMLIHANDCPLGNEAPHCHVIDLHILCVLTFSQLTPRDFVSLLSMNIETLEC